MCIKYLKILPSISPEEISRLWKQSDTLILLIDLNNYNVFSTEHLDEAEKENFKTLKTSYFKKRYAISRTILKYVLWNILGEQAGSEISIYKNKNGKLSVTDHEELYVSVSYTKNITALAISKIELGIDIELKRKMNLKNTLKYLNENSLLSNESMNENELLRIWTLKEAYCKFSNKNMPSIFNEELKLESACYSSYALNDEYILSLVTSIDSYSLNIGFLPKIACFENSEDYK